MRLRSRTSAALCAAALLVLPACSGGDDDSSSDEASAASADAVRYVALGDSYTAGPSINPVDGDSGECGRSTKNYPSVLAEELDVASFTDVSCSGATSENILKAVPIPGTTEPVPAQLDAVDESTSLVTVGIGGNDDGLFSSLATVCVAPGDACGTYLSKKLPRVLAATSERVTAVLDAVQQKAPEAEVLLVGYLRVTADGQSCDVLGGSGVDTSGVVQGEKQIDAALSKAAQAAGVTYVSMTAESEDHHACSDDPWTNGLNAPLGDGVGLHPNAEGMEAVADAVAEAAGQDS
ncbi:SGNH/GDSL hydrolase family protein [Aeromicrobium sp. IC_218]|uniref:SGNH/GDSL hydrolase family protein n=1 Tax=Aeromicrobium sp. IC_218 TaxID=2545468 RepID=UPI00103DAB27|nr:SGNH/GDSL hydrolase family protein [Aeromicrobium sp. IC_218]TCJ00268.1 SGNH/GDSL hydrolase family protein [Aeromicrobium sp. IC_218]